MSGSSAAYPVGSADLRLDPLARLVIEGAVSDGDTVQADWKEGGIVLKKK